MNFGKYLFLSGRFLHLSSLILLVLPALLPAIIGRVGVLLSPALRLLFAGGMA